MPILEPLETLDPEKMKFNVHEDVEHSFCIDDTPYERQMDGKKAKDPSMVVPLSSLFRSLISVLCCLRTYLVPLLFDFVY